jgi:hypothetical protein
MLRFRLVKLRQAAAGEGMQFDFSPADLWNDLNSAKLFEVMVECESLFDAQLRDYYLAGAICKAPILIRKTLECLPRKHEVRLVDLMDIG